MEFLGKTHPEWNGILGNCVNVIGITYLLNPSVIIFPLIHYLNPFCSTVEQKRQSACVIMYERNDEI